MTILAGIFIVLIGVMANGNEDGVTSVIVMYIIYISSGVEIAIYFIQQITAKSLWLQFKMPYLGTNTLLTTIMAIITSVTSFMPAAAGPYIPDGFTGNGNGRGIT